MRHCDWSDAFIMILRTALIGLQVRIYIRTDDLKKRVLPGLATGKSTQQMRHRRVILGGSTPQKNVYGAEKRPEIRMIRRLEIKMRFYVKLLTYYAAGILDWILTALTAFLERR